MDRTEREGTGEYRKPGLRDVDEQSIGELFSNLSRDTFKLVRQEIEYAKLEMTQKASRASWDSTTIMVGIGIAYAGLLSILTALVLVLASFMPVSLAALLVGLAAAGAGWLLVRYGKSRLQEKDLVPHQTMEAIKGDTQWIKDRMI